MNLFKLVKLPSIFSLPQKTIGDCFTFGVYFSLIQEIIADCFTLVKIDNCCEQTILFPLIRNNNHSADLRALGDKGTQKFNTIFCLCKWVKLDIENIHYFSSSEMIYITRILIKIAAVKTYS